MPLLNKSQEWEQRHWRLVFTDLKQAEIELTRENIPKIVKEMSFEVRSRKHPDKEHCWNYVGTEPTPCHPGVKNLNCLLGACPQYDSMTETGSCKINSEFAKYISTHLTSSNRILDCSDCNLYHSPNTIVRFLERNINELKEMSETLLNPDHL